MSNNQALTSVDRNELFDSIRKQDVNALREFIYHNSADIIDSIKYWKNKRLEPEIFKDKQQRDLMALEIIRLESLMLGRTEFTFSFFKIADDGVIQQNAEVISKDWFKSIEPSTAGDVVNLLENIADKSGKTIDMFPEKIKLADLRERCISLLTKGNGEEATALAMRYLSAGNYIPDKKTKNKVEKYHKGRVDSWILNLAKDIKKEPEVKNAIAADAAAEAAKSSVPIQTAKESQTPKPGAEKEIVDTVVSTPEKVENVSKETDNKVEDNIVPREGDVSLSLEDKDAFKAWLTETGRKLEDWFEPELIKDDKLFDEFTNVIVHTQDVDSLVKELIEVYHIDAKESIEEDLTFENSEMTLVEEISHIEKFIVKLQELRGTDLKKPENLDEIKDLIKTFFETREDEDYEEQDKVFDIIRDHPDYLKDAKSFFNLISYPKPTIFVAKDSQGKSTPDNYNAVITEIEAELKAADEKKEKEQERLLAKLEDKWVNQLRGQILAGKETREDKSVYIANKKTFYTKYHVYYFIDQIREGKITSKVAEVKEVKTPEKEVKADVSTAPKTDVTDKQTKKEDKKEAPKSENTKVIEKAYVCKTIEEALALVVKNGGKEEDAYVHPFCEALKGTTIKDPTGVFSMVLDDVNYKNYINKKYDEALAVYKSNLTEYPIEDMARLISNAIEAKQTAEDFVEENLSLIQKEDGSFLKIAGKIDKMDFNVPITSKEGFLSWVKEMYELEEKISINEVPEKVYEVSPTIKSYKDFEDQIKKKVAEDKVTLVDLKKWAHEVALDKAFGEDNHKMPYFFSDKERISYLDTYLEALTKSMYETPESKLKQENELKEYIIAKLKTTDQIFFGFLSEIRKYCTEKKFDYNFKSLKAIVLSLAETHNKTMFDTYKKLSDSSLATGNVNPELNTNVEKSDSEGTKEDENKIVANVLKEAKDATTKLELYKVIWKYKDNPAAVLRAAIHIIIGNKQIKDLKLTTIGEVNTWVTEAITGKKVDPPATEDVKVKSDSSSDGDDLFDNLSKSEKKTFRTHLDALVEANEDSTEFREKVIETLKSSESSHVRIVARQSLEEMHKMIKSAFERKEDRASQEKV